MAVRKRLDTDERRAQLIKLGREMFAAQSYDEVSVDEVAQRAGISKGLLYHYFRNKRAFYVAIVESAAMSLIARTIPDSKLGPLDQVERGVRSYLAYVDANRSAYTALMRSGVGSDSEVHQIVERVRRLMVGLVLSRMNRDRITPATRIAVRGWVGFVEAASLEWVQKDELSLEELTEMLVNLLVHLTSIRG